MKIPQETVEEIVVKLEKEWKEKKNETEGYKVKHTLMMNREKFI